MAASTPATGCFIHIALYKSIYGGTQVSAKYRHRLYQKLQDSLAQACAKAQNAGEDTGITPDIKGTDGPTCWFSSGQAVLRRNVTEAMDKAARSVPENRFLVDEPRDLIIKDGDGDPYDSVSLNSCEAAQGVALDLYCAPPVVARGDNNRTRYIVPAERHLNHHGDHAWPRPPRSEAIIADEGVTAGELGFMGKRQRADALLRRAFPESPQLAGGEVPTVFLAGP